MKLLVTGGAGFIGSNFYLLSIKNNFQNEIIFFNPFTYVRNMKTL